MRSEQEIFDDLAALCISPGFIHAIATICFRDNIVSFKKELKAKDMTRLFSESRLIRTEVTTLIGLMMRAPIDFTLPQPGKLFAYVKCSEKLLEELHDAIKSGGLKALFPEKLSEPDFNPFTLGDLLREAIFYGGESAYTFQYRDLAPLKYGADAQWLSEQRGVDLNAARQICKHVTEILNERLLTTLRGLRGKPLAEWTMLPGFAFSCAELAARTGLPVGSVRAVIEAFCVPEAEVNADFTTFHAFNSAYAYPFIRKGPDEFVLFQYYGIAEALYETPFYWMVDDKAYAPTALKHRGDFTEAFAVERLTRVFGVENVFQNVEILKTKGETLGEIDVLVTFGNRVIVVQAKSKKLTLEARKGNDLWLQRDFKAAVQDAVDQAFTCAALLGDPSVKFQCRDGREIRVSDQPSVIFPISLVADHYPALAFQARQFLKFKTTDRIVAPLVIDVFALDAATELLASPLRLLSYLGLRALFGEKLMMSHEHTLLSYHLKRNLWVESGTDLIMFDDDISSDLDVAMAVRRDGVPGAATPDGILTRFAGTPFARLVGAIEDKPEPATIDLGLMLMELNEDTIREFNKGIRQILARTAKDSGLHDFTLGISSASTGLTIHSSHSSDAEAATRLRAHCEKRKYIQKAASWFGLALHPDGSTRLVIELRSPWQFDVMMEIALGTSSSSRLQTTCATLKVGRNDPCPCGSGKKFKRCCIAR